MVSVFLKDRQYVDMFKHRNVDNLVPHTEFFNAFRFPLNNKFVHDWSWPNFPHPQGPEYPL